MKLSMNVNTHNNAYLSTAMTDRSNQNCSVFYTHFSSLPVHFCQFASLCSKKGSLYIKNYMYLNFWISYYEHFNFIKPKNISNVICS